MTHFSRVADDVVAVATAGPGVRCCGRCRVVELSATPSGLCGAVSDRVLCPRRSCLLLLAVQLLYVAEGCCCCRAPADVGVADRAGRAARSPLPITASPRAPSRRLVAALWPWLPLVPCRCRNPRPGHVGAAGRRDAAAAGSSTSWSRSSAAPAAQLWGVVAGGAAAAYSRLRYNLLLARSGCGGRSTPDR